MFEAEVKTIEPMVVAYLRMQGSYSQMSDGRDTLYSLASERGYTPAGAPMATFLTDPALGEERASWEIWAPINDVDNEVAPDETGLGVKWIPETTVASAMSTGPYEEMGPVYETLIAWVKVNGHTFVGAPQEVYLSDPDQVPPAEYVTEIRFPIAPSQGCAGASACTP